MNVLIKICRVYNIVPVGCYAFRSVFKSIRKCEPNVLGSVQPIELKYLLEVINWRDQVIPAVELADTIHEEFAMDIVLHFSQVKFK